MRRQPRAAAPDSWSSGVTSSNWLWEIFASVDCRRQEPARTADTRAPRDALRPSLIFHSWLPFRHCSQEKRIEPNTAKDWTRLRGAGLSTNRQQYGVSLRSSSKVQDRLVPRTGATRKRLRCYQGGIGHRCIANYNDRQATANHVTGPGSELQPVMSPGIDQDDLGDCRLCWSRISIKVNPHPLPPLTRLGRRHSH